MRKQEIPPVLLFAINEEEGDIPRPSRKRRLFIGIATASLCAFLTIPVFGDLNQDGVIDTEDLDTVSEWVGMDGDSDNVEEASSTGSSYTRSVAASDGSGWRSRSSCRGGGGGGGCSSTPEPSTFLLGLTGALLLTMHRSRGTTV